MFRPTRILAAAVLTAAFVQPALANNPGGIPKANSKSAPPSSKPVPPSKKPVLPSNKPVPPSNKPVPPNPIQGNTGGGSTTASNNTDSNPAIWKHPKGSKFIFKLNLGDLSGGFGGGSLGDGSSGSGVIAAGSNGQSDQASGLVQAGGVTYPVGGQVADNSGSGGDQGSVAQGDGSGGSSGTDAAADSVAILGVALTDPPNANSPAQAAKMKANDVILALGNVRTQSWEDMTGAANKFAGREVIAIILDGETGDQKSIRITPSVDGKLGVYVQQVRVN